MLIPTASTFSRRYYIDVINGVFVLWLRTLKMAVFETTLRPDEILTEIRVPAPKERSGGAYMKLERKVGDYAIARERLVKAKPYKKMWL